MDRRIPLLAAGFAAAMALGSLPEARADRLGGNFRGPNDLYRVREDAFAPTRARPAAAQDTLGPSLGLKLPYVLGVDAGRKEAQFRGRPLVLFFALEGCGKSAGVAARVFRDAEVAALCGRTVLALADSDREEESGIRLGVRTLPTILVLDGDGFESSRVEGAAGADRVLAALREVLRISGPARPVPAARDLEKEGALLARARRAKDWKAVLASALAIERIGHEGPELAEARAARDEASREAAGRLEAAKRRLDDGKPGARRAVSEVAGLFAGLPEAEEAEGLLQEVESARPKSSGIRLGLRSAGTPARGQEASPMRFRSWEPESEAPPVVESEVLPPPLPEPVNEEDVVIFIEEFP
jgi:hypothetical protein